MKRFIALTLVALCATCRAEFVDGNGLLNAINGSTTADRMHSLGYIVGVADTLRGISFCPPDNVMASQLRDMVRQYLEINPGIRHMSGDVIVSYVLKSAWPCAARGGRTS